MIDPTVIYEADLIVNGGPGSGRRPHGGGGVIPRLPHLEKMSAAGKVGDPKDKSMTHEKMALKGGQESLSAFAASSRAFDSNTVRDHEKAAVTHAKAGDAALTRGDRHQANYHLAEANKHQAEAVSQVKSRGIFGRIKYAITGNSIKQVT